MNEAAAIKALKRGDTAALEWFIDHYAPYVSAIIRGIIGGAMTPEDIEETAADVFLSLWSNAAKLRPESAKGYLGSIARSKSKNKLRELGRELPLEDDIIIISDDTPESLLEKRELECLVRQAVLDMEQPDREIFLRFYYYYQPLSQIAEEMSINLSTIKTRLRRGREHLKEVLLKNDSMKGGSLNGAENNRPAGLHRG